MSFRNYIENKSKYNKLRVQHGGIVHAMCRNCYEFFVIDPENGEGCWKKAQILL
jgi:hypothetical protein